jgi:PST family polysaccharide transporter/lipopolysaccharide exporter
MSLRVTALRSIPWTASATAANVVTRFLVMLAAAHALPPFDLGLYALVNIVLGFAYLFSDAGLTQAIISRPQASSEQIVSLYWVNVMSGLGICAILCLAAPLLAFLYGQPRLLGLLLVAALNFAILPFGQVYQALLQKQLRFATLGRIEVTINILSGLCGIGMLYAGVGVYALVLSQALAAAIRSIFLQVAGRDMLRVHLRLNFREIRPFVHFGVFQLGDRAINYLSSRLDQFLIGSLLGPQALGYYNMAWTLVVEPVYRLNPIITSVAFPIFAIRQNDARALKRGFLVMAKLLATTNAPLLFGIAAIAPNAIPLVLGQQWEPTVPLVELLSIIAIARTINNPVGSLVLSVGHADKSFYWTVAQFAVQLPIYAILLAHQGLEVATLFLCVVNVSAVSLVYACLVRPITGGMLAEYAGAFLPAIGLAIGMAIAVRLLAALTNEPGFTLLAAQISLGAALYIGATLFFRREELSQLVGLVAPRA